MREHPANDWPRFPIGSWLAVWLVRLLAQRHRVQRAPDKRNGELHNDCKLQIVTKRIWAQAKPLGGKDSRDQSWRQDKKGHPAHVDKFDNTQQPLNSHDQPSINCD